MAFTIHKGTNISHWLSQSAKRGTERRAYFTESDVKRIADWGFDHIRLPIDEEQMWDEAGNPEAEAFDLLDMALDWADAAQLSVIVDLHVLRSHHFLDEDTPALYTDPAEEKRFAGLWSQLSSHMQHRKTDLVAYEILNEAVARNPEDWNRVSRAAFDAIRENEKDRTIVLGSNWFCQHQTFFDLKVPDDPKMILTFHYYLPMFVTHYTARWWAVGGTYEGPVSYPGQPIADSDLEGLDGELLRHIEEEDWNKPFDRAVMDGDLYQPLTVRERTGLSLYCGEFGCYNRTPDPVRLAWFEDILAVLREHDISWANWDYKGSFGLVDNKGNETAILPLLRAG